MCHICCGVKLEESLGKGVTRPIVGAYVSLGIGGIKLDVVRTVVCALEFLV